MNNLQSVVAPIFRGGANIKLFPGTFLRADFGQGFRYPTITEKYIETKAGMFAVFPNPDLKPETSQSFEVGLKQGFKIGDFMGYLDVAGFYQTYKNTIEFLFGEWDPNISLAGFKFLNTGESMVRGLDFSLAGSSPEKNKITAEQKVIALGDATANALKKKGIKANKQPASFDDLGLVQAVFGI